MVNLAVTTVCPLRCSFCFAGPSPARSGAAGARPSSPHISLRAFDEHLDFLSRSGVDQVRLIGGEPTRHPRFPELVRRAGARHVVVFTSGLMRETALRCLEALPPERCTVLVNTNATRHPPTPTPAENRRRATVVRRLGPRVLLGATVFSVDLRLAPLLDLIETSGARRLVRIGLAQPLLGGENVYLHPKQYPAVGALLVDFAVRAAERGVRLSFDCGLVPCMFDPEGTAVLRETGADIGWRCNPVLDVAPDGTVSHCFPLAGATDLAVSGGGTADELRQRMIARTAGYRAAGIYRWCSRCERKRSGECTGGCLALAMRRFRGCPLRFELPAGPGAPEEDPPADGRRSDGLRAGDDRGHPTRNSGTRGRTHVGSGA